MASDNFDALIETLKETGKRLRQTHEELTRPLFGYGGEDDPFAPVRVPTSRNPPSQAGAIALPEPEDDVRVDVASRPSA